MRLAKTISIIGHPLLLGSSYVVLMSFHNLPVQTAMAVSLSVICLVTIPIIFNNWRKTKKGLYTNFDVSDQQQRKGFYPFAITLFVILLLVFWIFDFPIEVISKSLVFFVMVLLMALINLRLKASMHAGIAFYIAISVFSIGLWPGLFLLGLAILISWSRLVMQRHSGLELIVGGFVGIVFGWLSLIV
jgi:membrane-associated HD superfamily phosphohydrolase